MSATITGRICRLCNQPMTRHETVDGHIVCRDCIEELLAVDAIQSEASFIIVEGPSGSLYCHRDHTRIEAGRFCPACGEE